MLKLTIFLDDEDCFVAFGPSSQINIIVEPTPNELDSEHIGMRIETNGCMERQESTSTFIRE